MIILQRTEPSVDQSFPSQIPFWVRVQGIPKHLWYEETFKSIGNDIGIYEKQEITDSSARMRVQINGLVPLVMSSIIEFEEGFEVISRLVYEKLEKHCSFCFRLDHELQDCTLSNSRTPVTKEPIRPQSQFIHQGRSSESNTIKERKELGHTSLPRRQPSYENRSAHGSSFQSTTGPAHLNPQSRNHRDLRHYEKVHRH